MPQLDAFDIEPEDTAAKMELFRAFSRQVLYMALFDNDDHGLSIIDEAPADPEQPSAEAETEATADNAEALRNFSRYLYRQMAGDFESPDELSVAEWAELAHDVLTEPEPQTDLPRLAGKIYDLLKQELRLQRERRVGRRSW